MPKKTKDASTDEFGDPVEVHKTDVKHTDDAVEVGFRFPKDVDPSIIKEAMDTVGKITADRIKSKSAMDLSREEYKKKGHRRYKCMVESLRPNYKYFELIIPHPDTDRPIKVMGQCGVRLEQGLTMYAINALQTSYTMRTEEDSNVDEKASLALTYKTTKVPNYRVTVYEEVQNPKPVGSIGRSASPQAIG